MAAMSPSSTTRLPNGAVEDAGNYRYRSYRSGSLRTNGRSPHRMTGAEIVDKFEQTHGRLPDTDTLTSLIKNKPVRRAAIAYVELKAALQEAQQPQR